MMKDFHDQFITTLSSYEKSVWTKSKVRQNFPDLFPIGKYTGNKVCIGNLSFEDADVPLGGPKFTTKGGKLKLSNEDDDE
jgi:hypothetical protein